MGRSRSGERIVPGMGSAWVVCYVWLVWVVWGAETLKPLVSITSSMRVRAGRSKTWWRDRRTTWPSWHSFAPFGPGACKSRSRNGCGIESNSS